MFMSLKIVYIFANSAYPGKMHMGIHISQNTRLPPYPEWKRFAKVPVYRYPEWKGFAKVSVYQYPEWKGFAKVPVYRYPEWKGCRSTCLPVSRMKRVSKYLFTGIQNEKSVKVPVYRYSEWKGFANGTVYRYPEWKGLAKVPVYRYIFPEWKGLTLVLTWIDRQCFYTTWNIDKGTGAGGRSEEMWDKIRRSFPPETVAIIFVFPHRPALFIRESPTQFENSGSVKQTFAPVSAVGNAPDCRSRGREFNPSPVPYFSGDWSWNNFYGHSPLSADSKRVVVSYRWRYVHKVLVSRLVKHVQE